MLPRPSGTMAIANSVRDWSVADLSRPRDSSQPTARVHPEPLHLARMVKPWPQLGVPARRRLGRSRSGWITIIRHPSEPLMGRQGSKASGTTPYSSLPVTMMRRSAVRNRGVRHGNLWESSATRLIPSAGAELLQLVGDAAAARLSGAAPGEPLWLTWRSLSGAFECSDAGVSVCENPAVVIASADEHGGRSRSQVCANGRPSGATWRLLTRLAASGTQLHVRADDDPTGQEIVASLRPTLPNSDHGRYSPRGASGRELHPGTRSRTSNPSSPTLLRVRR